MFTKLRFGRETTEIGGKTDVIPTPEKGSSSGFLVFAFVFMVLVSVVVLLPLYPNDFWPYIRIGAEIVRTGGIPTTEFMSFTQFGQPVVYLYWLPSLLLWGSYQLGGVTLISVISVFCISGFYVLLWFCLREFKTGPISSGFILLVTAMVGINDWATRPQVFTFPLFGLALLAVLYWQRKNDRLLWVIPLISMLWVNFHGSFVVLFLVLIPAILFGTGNRKRMLIVIALAFLATLVNHYGFDVWTRMFSMVNSSSIRLYSQEWRPPINDSWQANIFFATFLVIPFLIAATRPKIPLLYWVWFLGFGWMALSTVRFAIWFLAFESFLLEMIFGPIYQRIGKRRKYFQSVLFNRILGLALLVFPIALLPGIRGLWWEGAPPVYTNTTPVRAAEWLKHNSELPGEMWSDFSFSTYLAYALPERRLFISNRFEDFPIWQFVENKQIGDGDYDWQSLLDKYRVNLILASIPLQPELIQAAHQSADWNQVYRDEQAIIFIRNHPLGD
ncbi:MAG: hypothetical protein NTZ74_16405 [Chloroflexi bacterium]|nr:hypothetical protein [Chloroflexota bacterium]